MIEYLQVEGLNLAPFGLSPGAAIGDLVFAGGMALDPTTFRPMADAVTVADETRLALESLANVLAAGGCGLADIAKITCYIADESYRAEFLAAYNQVFPGPRYPARATFVVGIANGCRVEFDAVALRPKAAGA